MAKYPRTFHLPWSPGSTSDDKKAKSVDSLLNKRIIITEKVDGSNVCMTSKECFSRSHAGPPTHASFDAFKAMHSYIKNAIPENYEVYGEWCFALHSIAYDKLPAFFLGFGVRINDDQWLSWSECCELFDELGVPSVPVLMIATVSSEAELKKITIELAEGESRIGKEREGVVVRNADTFQNNKFSLNVMKWVRKDHVQTDQHWKDQEIVRNKLA